MIQHIEILLALENEEWTCANCGMVCNREYKYCPHCGEKRGSEEK